MQQIHIDARMAKHTGIGRYLRGLISHLPNQDAGRRYTLIRSEETNRLFPPDFNSIRLDAPIYSLREQIALLGAAKNSNCLHVPHYNAPLLWKRKLVVTIHDLIHLHFPEYLPSRTAVLYARTLIPLIARKADALIAVSQHTKDDLVQTLHVPGEKIFVIHHGIDPSFVSTNHRASEDADQGPYFLCVGLLKMHKNVGVLLEAFKRLKEKCGFGNLKLLLIGTADTKQQMVRKWLQTIEEEPLISLRSNVNDDELKQAYRRARAVVFPSRYEGFGFPLIEAMASQVPIIAARATSTPEVLGEGAALYFDPDSVSELVDCMEAVLGQVDLRERLKSEGRKRLARFDWQAAAQKTENVYESVLGSD